MRYLLLLLFFVGNLTFAQQYPKKGHEVGVIATYSFHAPKYSKISVAEYLDLQPNNHVAKYGLGYTFRKKRLRHHLYINSSKVSYDYERSTGDSFGWTETNGSVSQQYLEFGGYGGLKVMDSVALYPCIGFSFGMPIVGKNSGTYRSGAITVEEDFIYEFMSAPTRSFDLRLGLLYNWQSDGNFGVNTSIFYSRSLVHPELVALDAHYGKLKVDQFMLNIGLYYFIKS